MSRWIQVALCAFLAAGLPAAVVQAEVADEDLSYLTPDTLPPVRLVVEAALDSLPKSLGELQDWDRRMHLSALMPILQVRYGEDEGPADRFEYHDVTTRRDTRSSDSANNTQVKIANDPLDSFVQSTDIDGSDRISFTETEYGRPVPADDELVWRQSYFVQATWRLDQLVYHNDEIEAAQVNRFIAAYRVDFMQKVVNMYKRLKESVSDFARKPESSFVRDEVINQLVLIDSITENFVSEYARKRHGEINGKPAAAEAPVLRTTATRVNVEPQAGEPTAGRIEPLGNSEEALEWTPNVATVPGTLADIRRQDMMEEEARERMEIEESSRNELDQGE